MHDFIMPSFWMTKGAVEVTKTTDDDAIEYKLVVSVQSGTIGIIF